MLLELPAECVLNILKEIPVAGVVSLGCSCSGAASHLDGQQHTPLAEQHALLIAALLHCAVDFVSCITRHQQLMMLLLCVFVQRCGC
jgi:hypothetical protein